MGEEETLSSTFLSISNEELTSILSKIGAPHRLTYPDKLSGVVRRSFPAKALSSFTRLFTRPTS
jgi:hypothetical protein